MRRCCKWKGNLLPEQVEKFAIQSRFRVRDRLCCLGASFSSFSSLRAFASKTLLYGPPENDIIGITVVGQEIKI